MIILHTLERVGEPLPDEPEDGGIWRVCGMQYFLNSEKEKADIFMHDANLIYALKGKHIKVVMRELNLVR